VFSRFGALRERFYNEVIWLQILKTLREEKNAVRELRRCEKRGHIFQYLVICISLVSKYYVHARARYILLSHDFQAWSRARRTMVRVCVRAGFSNILSARRQHASAWALERRLSSPSTSPSRRQDNMDRGSQVLAQDVPPGVPKSYRALADHNLLYWGATWPARNSARAKKLSGSTPHKHQLPHRRHVWYPFKLISLR
jgi:hypothetical protein